MEPFHSTAPTGWCGRKTPATLLRSTYYDEPEIQPIDEARLVEQIKEVCAELG
jgi:hypothetical protein